MSIEDEIRKMSDIRLQKAKESSVDWYMDMVRGLRSAQSNKRLKKLQIEPIVQTMRSNQSFYIGGMYQYIYIAKHRETLPFWDAFPLMIPVSFYGDGFLGLNLHYLPLTPRVRLLDKLMKYQKVLTTGSNGVRKYMELTYPMLKSVKNTPWEVCIKRYLYDHIKSKIMIVKPDFWRNVATLPSQRFQKQTADYVWKQYKKRK